MLKKMRQILAELRIHAPFTIIGALTGILFMLLFRNLDKQHIHTLFSVFHPAHVLLSAMVTAALFKLHRNAKNFLAILLIGYIGSVGIATLSDCIIPYFGESVLGVSVPTHRHSHSDAEHDCSDVDSGSSHGEHPSANSTLGHSPHDVPEADHKPKLHLGFIEEWQIVTPAAILGVIIAYLFPTTKYPHALHVLISTWASSSHMLMNTQAEFTVSLAIGFFVVLFLAVWLPCCASDIIFPMLFVRVNGSAHVGSSHCILCGQKTDETKATESPESS